MLDLVFTGNDQVVDRGDPAEQAQFVAEVQAQNRLSSVTFADDYPVERHTGWGEFPVYGTMYEVNFDILHIYTKCVTIA